MLLHLGQLLHLGLQHTSQSSWLLLTKYIWALVSVWFIISSKPCGWYTALILWSVPHNLNSSSLTLLTNSWPWSDITIFATPYLVIRLYRKSATSRGPINICLLEQVKFKPSLNLTQASIKKSYQYLVALLHFPKKIVLASSKLLQIFDICDRLYARKIM